MRILKYISDISISLEPGFNSHIDYNHHQDPSQADESYLRLIRLDIYNFFLKSVEPRTAFHTVLHSAKPNGSLVNWDSPGTLKSVLDFDFSAKGICQNAFSE